MGSDCHSSASCGLVRGGEREREREREKEEEDEKTHKKIKLKKKKDGRRIKVCNKRI